jgi:hypothetical protein
MSKKPQAGEFEVAIWPSAVRECVMTTRQAAELNGVFAGNDSRAKVVIPASNYARLASFPPNNLLGAYLMEDGCAA